MKSHESANNLTQSGIALRLSGLGNGIKTGFQSIVQPRFYKKIAGLSESIWAAKDTRTVKVTHVGGEIILEYEWPQTWDHRYLATLAINPRERTMSGIQQLYDHYGTPRDNVSPLTPAKTRRFAKKSLRLMASKNAVDSSNR